MSEKLTASILIVLALGLSQQALSQQQTPGLVYTKFAASGPEIWRVDTDGSNSRRIGAGADATWSPDGAQLAFVKEVDGNVDVYTMDADGGNVLRLTSDAADEHSPTWSPDGSMIAFNSDRSGSDQIWRTNVESGNWGTIQST